MASYFSQRNPQTKIKINETYEGLIEGRKSQTRDDLEARLTSISAASVSLIARGRRLFMEHCQPSLKRFNTRAVFIREIYLYHVSTDRTYGEESRICSIKYLSPPNNPSHAAHLRH